MVTIFSLPDGWGERIRDKVASAPEAERERVVQEALLAEFTGVKTFAREDSPLARAETRVQRPPAKARRLLDFLEVDDEEAAKVFKDLIKGYERLTSLNEQLRSYIYIVLKSGETASYFSRDLVQISPVNLEGILRVSHQKHREMYQAVAQKTFADVPEVEGGEAPMLYLTWRLGRYVDAFASFKSMFDDQELRALIVGADFTLLDH